MPVAQRRLRAEREMTKLRKKGQPVSPVMISGRVIAKTFWGRAWCENLERYSDYSNRLPRGRNYVRNGSVVDLQIGPGEVKALVSGTHIYRVTVRVAPVPKARWRSICQDCAGSIDSLVELLQGRFSRGVMERLCRQGTGLFPSPREIEFACSCPDWASMCKHVAAVLYGVGARLDVEPELLFKLNNVDASGLITRAGEGLPLAGKGPAADKVLADAKLSELFGIEIAQERQPEAKIFPRVMKTKPLKQSGGEKKKAAKAAPARSRRRGRTGKTLKTGLKNSRKRKRTLKKLAVGIGLTRRFSLLEKQIRSLNHEKRRGRKNGKDDR